VPYRDILAQDRNKDYITVIHNEGIMKLSTSVRPISYLKAHASEVIRDIVETREPMIVTHNGQAKVVVQDIRSYERMQHTLALLKLLTRSKENIKRGNVKPMDAAFLSLKKRIATRGHEKI
jgi:prevent-host-death family protein